METKLKLDCQGLFCLLERILCEMLATIGNSKRRHFEMKREFEREGREIQRGIRLPACKAFACLPRQEISLVF